MKSSYVSSIPLSKDFKETSLTVSGLLIDSEAKGTFYPSKRGFILKATRCFFDSSYMSFSCSMSSAVTVSRIN